MVHLLSFLIGGLFGWYVFAPLFSGYAPFTSIHEQSYDIVYNNGRNQLQKDTRIKLWIISLILWAGALALNMYFFG